MKRRVLQVTKHLDRGGAEVLVAQTFKAFDREKYEFAFAHFTPGHEMLGDELREAGAETTCFGAPSQAAMLSATTRLARHIEAWRADVVHCHLPLPGVIGRLAAALAGVPVVYTEHNYIERYHPITRAAHVCTSHLLSHAIAVSSEVAASFQRNCGERIPLTVIKNAVDTEWFVRSNGDRARIRRELGFPEDAVVLGAVSVFRPVKRLDLWLQAAARVAGERPRARFMLVGFGPLAGALRMQAEELGLGETMRFIGPQLDVRPFLSAMDVGVMSSEYEGLPVAMLEAMCTGLPVVATRVGGVPEVVRHEREGLLVQSGDGEGLAAACMRLVDDPDLRVRLGRGARARVNDGFGIQRLSREIEQVYDAVLARAGAVPC